jgi:uncharacterized protein YjdB
MMMRRSAITGIALAAFFALACSDDKGTGPGPVDPVPTSLAAVGSVPETAVVATALAEPIRIRVLDAKDEAMSGIQVSWSVTAGGGSLSATSSTTNANGEASVTWTLGTEAGENAAKATVGTLAPVAFKVRGEPDQPATIDLLVGGEVVDTLSFTAIGESLQLAAHVEDEHGNEIEAPTLEWSTSDTTVTTVDSTGLVTAKGQGEAEITVKANTVSVTVTVRVTETPPESPTPSTLSVVGTVPETATAGAPLAEPIRVRVLDAKAEPMSGVLVIWSVVTGGGSISAASFTTDTSGESSVTWTLGKAAGANEARATVGDLAPVVFKVQGVPGAPATVTILAAGEPVDTIAFGVLDVLRRLSARVVDGHGNEIAAPALEWSTSDAAVATVDSTGLVIRQGAGSAQITARADTATGTITVRIPQRPYAVRVTPAALSLGEGEWQDLQAKAVDRDENEIPDAEISWRSSDTTVATVDASGRVTGVAEGRARITATSGHVFSASEVTVLGKIVYVQAGGIYSMNTDGSGSKSLNTNGGAPSWSADGSKIVYHGQDQSFAPYRIYVMNADGTGKGAITETAWWSYDPAFSPGGSKIAFVSNRHGGYLRIYVMDSDGSNVTLVSDTTAASNAGEPSWSPDGSRIAYSGGGNIYVMDQNGSNRWIIAAAGDNTNNLSPSWSPDGTKIAFKRTTTTAVGGTDTGHICIVAAEAGTPTCITSGSVIDRFPTWSPDGSMIAFDSKREGDVFTQIYMVNVNGTGLTRITDGTTASAHPAWRPAPKR